MLPYFQRILIVSAIFLCFGSILLVSGDSGQSNEVDNGDITIPLQSFKTVFDSFLRQPYPMYDSRGYKKMALPFLLGVTLKMTTLIPMVTSLMTIIGGVALLSSKLALLISLGLALHYYVASKQQLHHQAHLQGVAYEHAGHPYPASPYPVSHRFSVQA